MRIRTPLVLGCLIVAWLAALSPSTAEAQRYRRRVFVGAGFHSPFWYPWGYSAYGFFPHGFYPYGFYPYGPYPYGPYPYAPYWFDGSSDVRIQVTPRDAEVYVDGRFAGKVDDFDGMFQRLRVEPGGHEIVLYHERFQPITEKLYLSPRAGYKIQREMVPLSPGEAAPPRPVPAQAPAEVERRRARPGYPERNQAPSSRFGTLSIRVQPADAEVFVDGERWRFPDSSDRLVLELSDGAHRVEIRKNGHEPYATDVRVRAGETATLNVSLPRP